MGEDIFKQKRKSYIEVGEVFFRTATINQWQKLLWEDNYKNVIISSLKYLTNEGKIVVYAFVITTIFILPQLSVVYLATKR